MAGLSRKDLKHDKFVEEVGHQVEYVSKHRTLVVGGAVLLVAAIVGISSWMGYRASVEAEARQALQEAVRLFHGSVTTDQRVGFQTFATTGERVRRTTEALEGVRDDYPGTEQAAGALYYLALLDLEQDKLDEAQQKLEQAIGGKAGYASLARLTLADVYGRKGDVENARKHYQYLIDNPSGVVTADRAKLAFGRFLGKHDPEAAKPVLESLIEDSSPAAGAATTALRDITNRS